MDRPAYDEGSELAEEDGSIFRIISRIQTRHPMCSRWCMLALMDPLTAFLVQCSSQGRSVNHCQPAHHQNAPARLGPDLADKMVISGRALGHFRGSYGPKERAGLRSLQ